MTEDLYAIDESTAALCPTCLKQIPARVVEHGGAVYLQKKCPEHGASQALLSVDPAYHRRQRDLEVRTRRPLRTNTETVRGCPYDCGLCPDHEQHSCISIVEVTDHCNLSCPICYAESSPQRDKHRSMAEICAMLDTTVLNEGQPDVVQISGGEPTTHPNFFDILAEARKRPIKHLMVNTNGLALARSPEFAARLAKFKPGFEIYLQFDGLDDDTYRTLRGATLFAQKKAALENLERHGISTTLVMTVMRGVNEGQIGAVVDFALSYKCVRGVTLQPVQEAGRTDGFDGAHHRLTLSEVRRALLDQHSLFSESDVVPVPCHPDCIAMAYGLKLGGETIALSGKIPPEVLVEAASDTITLERHPALRDELSQLFSAAHSPESASEQLGRVLCCLPEIESSADLSYENVFRVMIMQFMDAETLDIRSVKRSCVHIVHPDGRVIPFDTYNLFYRDGLCLPKPVELRVPDQSHSKSRSKSHLLNHTGR